jgi:hypothetical protein
MKKLTSVLLALAMIMALAIPAFADDQPITPGDDGTAKTTYSTSAKSFEMKVTLSGNSNIKAVFNPYGIKVTDSVLKVEEATAQILTAPVFITSKTEVDMYIDAKFVAVPSPAKAAEGNTPAVAASGITKIATSPVTATGDKTKDLKNVFVYFEIAKASDASEAPSWATIDATKATLFTNLETAQATLKAASTDDAKKTAQEGVDAAVAALAAAGLCPSQTLASGKTIDDDAKLITFEKICTMSAGNEEPTYAAFHLGGNALKAPYAKNGSAYEPSTWAANDTFDASVVLSFRPAVADAVPAQNNNNG